MITPYLHVYNKPKEQVTSGEQFRARYPAFDYRHTIDAIGGFDTATCRLQVSRAEAEFIFERYIANHVRFYVDNPNAPIWEGFVNRITIKTGTISITRSLDEMYNIVSVIYDDPAATPATTRTAFTSNISSAAIYGWKSALIEAGVQRSGSSTATAIRDKRLAQLAWPLISSALEPGQFGIELEFLGFYHTIGWDKARVTTTTSEAAGTVMYRYLYTGASPEYTGFNSSTTAGNGNGLFYDDTDDTLWTANTTFTTLHENQTNTRWEKITKMLEGGDTAVDWVVGITPTDPSRGYRRAYYRAANTTVEYTTSAYGLTAIYNPYGSIVNPWDVRPDRSLRIRDMLNFYVVSNAGEKDPRQLWIKRVEYDANQNVVTWQGRDDITVEGVFNFKDAAKNHGEKLGAAERVKYS